MGFLFSGICLSKCFKNGSGSLGETLTRSLCYRMNKYFCSKEWLYGQLLSHVRKSKSNELHWLLLNLIFLILPRRCSNRMLLLRVEAVVVIFLFSFSRYLNLEMCCCTLRMFTVKELSNFHVVCILWHIQIKMRTLYVKLWLR